jgi:hypothetical protein
VSLDIRADDSAASLECVTVKVCLVVILGLLGVGMLRPEACAIPAHIGGYALAEIGLWIELDLGTTICANLDRAHFDLLTDGLVKAAGCET